MGINASRQCTQRVNPFKDHSFLPSCNCLDGPEMSATESAKKQKDVSSNWKTTVSSGQRAAQVGSTDIILLPRDVEFWFLEF